MRQTTEAPKLTFALIARRAQRGQREEDEGRRRNKMVKRDPVVAKVVRSRCRVCAVVFRSVSRGRIGRERVERTVVCGVPDRNDGEGL